MHELMKYICDELEELERKAAKEGKLSMAEIQYGDTLAHFKKNLLKSEEMWDESEYSEYSMERGGQGGGGRGGNRGGGRGGQSNAMRGGSYAYEGGSYEGGSYEGGGSYARGGGGRGRNARRDSMGRYSRGEGLAEELRDLMEEAPDEQMKQEFRRFISKIENMQ